MAITKRNSLFALTFATLLLLPVTPQTQSQGGIRSIDFRNFRYTPKGADEGGEVILHNGRSMDDYGQPTELVAVSFTDFDGDGQEEAAVALRTTVLGSMGHFDDYYVYSYRNGAPTRIFHMGVERPKGMRIVGRSLMITEPFYGDSDPECCPTFEETTTYEWRGSSFIEISRRRSTVKRKGSLRGEVASNPGHELTEEQRQEALGILSGLTKATSMAVELGGSYSDYKLAVEVASYYQVNLGSLPDSEIRSLLTRIYLSHYDALLVWGLHDGLDPGPMFSMAEFRRNLSTRYGIRIPIRRSNRQARDQSLRRIWQIQINLEQRVTNLLK